MLPLEQLHIACTAVNKAMVAGALVDRFLTLTACMVLARIDDVALCRAHNGPGAKSGGTYPNRCGIHCFTCLLVENVRTMVSMSVIISAGVEPMSHPPVQWLSVVCCQDKKSYACLSAMCCVV